MSLPHFSVPRHLTPIGPITDRIRFASDLRLKTEVVGEVERVAIRDFFPGRTPYTGSVTVFLGLEKIELPDGTESTSVRTQELRVTFWLDVKSADAVLHTAGKFATLVNPMVGASPGGLYFQALGFELRERGEK